MFVNENKIKSTFQKEEIKNCWEFKMFNFCNFYITSVKWNLNIYFAVHLLKIANKISKSNLCTDFVLEKRSFIFRFIKILIGDLNA
ncbi:hypothetical protein D8X55_00960 [Malacoplasma penetrans]|uniref:Uncharacterized protein n=1 Tax=Malacoplasma penetrans (strain HF-2) TaxID=272633 RepID=Q8EVU5_MALP2|nr:hypothetical protein [Malacoplasma penetrans]RXY97254.1 hypothetical protein D8X55_00960 [Malacoplasma penetrans]BAC44254.1 hypothetical protein [Malacoplasma penetrans HF-2]